jgi:agmatinase
MIKTITNTTNIAEADVIFVSAPYEKTASSHKGTARGPAAVINFLDTQIEFFDRTYKVEVNNFVKSAHINLAEIEELSPKHAYEKIRDNSKNLVAQNKFIFLLGGEHSVGIGNFEALKDKYAPKDVTILHIDAHCDLRPDDSDYNDTPSEFAHSTVMHWASEMGYNLVQVGLRSFSKDEHDYFMNPKNNITAFEWTKNIPKIDDILKAIKTKYIYISIDVDGFDPSVMPGTGTPVQGGLGWYYGLELIERAILEHELIGADIVEVSPEPHTVITEYGAAQLAYTIIANKFRNRFEK